MTRKTKTRNEDRDREGLELDEDLGFQIAEWRAQRVAWVIMALVVIAALAGLVGPGPLSAARAAGGSVEVTYDRFLRYGVDTEVTVTARGPATADSLVVRFARGYLESFEIVQTHPEPVAQLAAAADLVHVFHFADGAERRVVYRLEPKAAGRVRGAVAVDGSGAVTLSAFVYP